MRAGATAQNNGDAEKALPYRLLDLTWQGDNDKSTLPTTILGKSRPDLAEVEVAGRAPPSARSRCPCGFTGAIRCTRYLDQNKNDPLSPLPHGNCDLSLLPIGHCICDKSQLPLHPLLKRKTEKSLNRTTPQNNHLTSLPKRHSALKIASTGDPGC